MVLGQLRSRTVAMATHSRRRCEGAAPAAGGAPRRLAVHRLHYMTPKRAEPCDHTFGKSLLILPAWESCSGASVQPGAAARRRRGAWVAVQRRRL